MTAPRLLDLGCKAGGAAKGYADAGFTVVGVDIEPQPHFPYEFHLGDMLTYPLAGYDVIHASPPCQLFSTSAPGRKRDGHPDLLNPMLERLRASGLPYVIENVATAPMPGSVLLCGSTFGLPLIRHRRFWINPDPLLVPSLCPQSRWQRGVAHAGRYSYGHGNWDPAWRKHVLPVVWPWMTAEESGQAVPPAYTEWIGRHLLNALERAA